MDDTPDLINFVFSSMVVMIVLFIPFAIYKGSEEKVYREKLNLATYACSNGLKTECTTYVKWLEDNKYKDSAEMSKMFYKTETGKDLTNGN